MRKVLAFLLAACAPVGLAAQTSSLTEAIEPDSQRLLAARSLLEVIFPPAERTRLFNGILQTMIGNLVTGARQSGGIPEDPRASGIIDRFVADITEDEKQQLEIAMPSLFEAYAKAYARNFSANELGQIRAFVETPAGVKFFQRSQLLLSDPDVSRWQRDASAQSLKRAKPRIQAMQAELSALKAK